MNSTFVFRVISKWRKFQLLSRPLKQFQSNNTISTYCKNVILRENTILQFRKPWNSSFRGMHLSRGLFDPRVIKVPPFAESVAEGDIRWEKAVGDFVNEDELVGEVETDKTAMPIQAPCAGTIVELMVADGDTVTAEQEIYRIEPGKGSAKPAEETPKPAAEAPKPETTSAPSSAASTSPSSPRDAIKVVQPPADLASLKLATAPSHSLGSGSLRGEQRVKMNRMRLRIAERLKEAQNTCAMLTTFNEIDMSSIYDLRAQYKESFLKKHNVKLGFMSAFCKGAAIALKDQSSVNAVIDGGEIVYRDYVDISIAVSTPKGLVVPVLRDVDGMNFADIEKGIMALGEKAKSGNLAVEDMDGGTFTISNGGVFGSLFGTPIINPPQSAILGLHGVFERPVVRNGVVVPRPMMYVALTYDHRLIDGREAVTFLRKIKAFIEDPRICLLDM